MIENLRINLKFKWQYIKKSLREKCPNTEFFLVRIFPHSGWIRRDSYSDLTRKNTDQKKLRIWTLFTQWIAPCLYSDLERILYSDAASDMWKYLHMAIKVPS